MMAMAETAPQPRGSKFRAPKSFSRRLRVFFPEPDPLTSATMLRLTQYYTYRRNTGNALGRARNPVSPPASSANSMVDQAADGQARRRPFSTLMKKLANLKGVSSSDGGRQANSKLNNIKMSTKKRGGKKNNPYPQSGRVGVSVPAPGSHYSLSTARTGVTSGRTSLDRDASVRLSGDGRGPATLGGQSMAPTISTDHETSRSLGAPSHGASSLAGTSRTANGGLDSRRGGDSTFSSPAPSVRSLTTTLTTIQSLGNGVPVHNHLNTTTTNNGHLSATSQVIHFNQPFPTTSPASAIPAHLTPSGSISGAGHPTTYHMATANNLLTDNASIVTLASSSKRRRRRSFDTDASVRALAPSSLWGGSRESLPLSVLSATMDGVGGAVAGGPTTPGLHRGAGGMANERTSIYSATGILSGDRSSFYAKAALNGSVGTGLGNGIVAGDGVSVHSGLLGHGRADSVSGSIGGIAASPLASPKEAVDGVYDHLEEDEEDEEEGDDDEAEAEEGDTRADSHAPQNAGKGTEKQ